jgi:hypothetical protein
MDMEYNLGDRLILDGLRGLWEIAWIGTYPDSTKRYILKIEANHKYKHAEGAEMVCCENTLKRLTSRN